MQLKNPKMFVLLPLLAGFCFNYLFWGKTVGVSFAIFVAVAVVVGLFLGRREGVRPAPWSLLLLVPIAFFSAMTAVRTEQMTTFLNYLAALLLLGTFAHSFIGGRWPYYNIVQYIVAAVNLAISALARQMKMLDRKPQEGGEAEAPEKKRGLGGSILRGLLLALPVVMVLAVLLAAADPIFERGLQDLLELLDLENLAELLWRGFIIALVAYLLAGIYLHAFYKSRDEDVSTEENNKFTLGFVESTIVLGSVNLLFLIFVGIQFRYFFGGRTNIHINGYTYAEYARNGFGEMVFAAFICLMLLQVISAVTRREEKSQRTAFSALGATLVLLVGIMLVSAFQRLLLYVNAYGFSQSRAYTQVFIFWLAGLLLVTMLLVITRRQRFFTFAMCMAALGFIANLDILNVDDYIVRQNVARAEVVEGSIVGETERQTRGVGVKNLDFQYLSTLSTDALPTLVELYEEHPEYRDELAGAIACHAYRNDYYVYSGIKRWDYNWTSLHFSHGIALNEWQRLIQQYGKENFKIYTEKEDWGGEKYVLVKGEKYHCYSYSNWD